MVFSAPVFLTLFLPIVIVFYFAVPRRARNLVLLGASLLFYVWGAGTEVWVLFVVILTTFLGALVVAAIPSGSMWRRLVFALAIVATLAPLIWFKYAAFFAEIVASVSGTQPALTAVALPIGISFFTFQALSYLIDVGRGMAPGLRNFLDYTLFVSLFPQLVAGPIVRYTEIRDRLLERWTSNDDLLVGVTRFTHGLFKKVVVADTVAVFADVVFANPESSMLSAWIGVTAYTVQIYFDFSGYSDMAIGLGRIFGFRFPENFNRPYSSVSITDFWRRWHMTLSRWFRDYVYIPLGGSRTGSTGRDYFNLAFVFFVTAFWHGAAWTFLVWGGIHSAVMLVERAVKRTGIRGQKGLGRFLTLVIVMVAWVFFRAASVADALLIIRTMFTPSGAQLDPLLVAAATPLNVLVLAAAVIVFFLPSHLSAAELISVDRGVGLPRRLAYLYLTLPLSLFLVFTSSYSPFLYFQF